MQRLGELEPGPGVAGVGLDPGAQIVDRAGILGLAGKRDTGVRPLDLGSTRDRGRRAVEHRFGLVQRALRDLHLGEPGIGGGLAVVFLEDRGKGLGRVVERPLGQHLLRRGDGGGQRAFGGEGRHLGDELVHLAARQRTLEAVDRLTVVEGIDGRDRPDPELLRDLRVLVDIDLDHLHLAAGRLHRRFQRRAELLAGAAPRRPEIDDDRHLFRGLDHVLHEGRLGDVLDQIARTRGRARLSHFKHVRCSSCSRVGPYMGAIATRSNPAWRARRFTSGLRLSRPFRPEPEQVWRKRRRQAPRPAPRAESAIQLPANAVTWRQ